MAVTAARSALDDGMREAILNHVREEEIVCHVLRRDQHPQPDGLGARPWPSTCAWRSSAWA